MTLVYQYLQFLTIIPIIVTMNTSRVVLKLLAKNVFPCSWKSLTLWSRVTLRCYSNMCQASKKLTALYQTRKFIALFTRTSTPPLSQFSQPVQIHLSHFLKIQCNAIFPSVMFKMDCLSSHFPIKTLHYTLSSTSWIPYDPPTAQTLILSLSALRGAFKL